MHEHTRDGCKAPIRDGQDQRTPLAPRPPFAANAPVDCGAVPKTQQSCRQRQQRHRRRLTTPAAGAESTTTIPASSSTADAAPSSLEFSSEEAYHDHLRGQGKLPLGFRVGTDGLRFVPAEVPTEVTMNVTAIVLDEVCMGAARERGGGCGVVCRASCRLVELIVVIGYITWLVHLIDGSFRPALVPLRSLYLPLFHQPSLPPFICYREIPQSDPVPSHLAPPLSTNKPSDRWAAVFTRNMFPGAPVIVGKERLAAEGRAIQAIVVNNKVRCWPDTGLLAFAALSLWIVGRTTSSINLSKMLTLIKGWLS